MFQDPVLVKLLIGLGAFVLFVLWLVIDFKELRKKKK